VSLAGKGGRPIGTPKTGGRQKGTPNRMTLHVADILIRLNCDPIEGLARIAMDEDNPVDVRARCYIELAQYLYPKRKPVDVARDERTPINVNVNLDNSDGSPDVRHQP
jgi:hypothetical protein